MKWFWLKAFALVLLGPGCVTAPMRDGHELKNYGQPSSTDAATVARSQTPEVQQTTAYAPDPGKAPPIEGQLACRVRATVDGIAILDDELKQAAYQELMAARNLSEPERSARQREIIRRELEKLIERELILKEARERMEKRPQAWQKLQEYAGKEFDKQLRSYKTRIAATGATCETDEQFKEILAAQGMTVEALQRQSERGFMSMEYMRHRVYPIVEKLGHKEIRDYYDQHPGEFQLEDRVHWQDIFISAAKHPNREAARRFAEEIARAARMGDDFARLCQMYDDGDSAGRKGDGYGQKRGEIRPVEAEQSLFGMQDGEVGPILEISTGFHVIRLVERQYAGMEPFDEKSQTLIKKKLQNIVMEREYRRIVNEMKRRAVIQVIDSDL